MSHHNAKLCEKRKMERNFHHAEKSLISFANFTSVMIFPRPIVVFHTALVGRREKSQFSFFEKKIFFFHFLIEEKKLSYAAPETDEDDERACERGRERESLFLSFPTSQPTQRKSKSMTYLKITSRTSSDITLRESERFFFVCFIVRAVRGCMADECVKKFENRRMSSTDFVLLCKRD